LPTYILIEAYYKVRCNDFCFTVWSASETI